MIALGIKAIAQLASLQMKIYNEANEQSDYVTANLMTQLVMRVQQLFLSIGRRRGKRNKYVA